MGADTVFFLSDYGRSDEFVGVVHAVLRRLAPRARVIDLTHDLAPFDVAAGARALARAQPHLGPGVVLAVVDPGVGGSRRGVALEVADRGGPRHWVGPDNGLLSLATAAAGGVAAAVELAAPGRPSTFDGRDVFAPAAAALCGGSGLYDLGRAVDPTSLVALLDPVAEEGRDAQGRRWLRAEVAWVDRFGNAQLAAPGALVPASAARVTVTPPAGVERRLRRVGAYADLAPGEAGLLVDANGRLALVVREGSAAADLGVTARTRVELRW